MAATSQFHSVPNPGLLPQTGTPGDSYWVQSTGLAYIVIGDGSLVPLLQAVPIPVAGPQGPIGNTGPKGDSITGSIANFGTWEPNIPYGVGSVVTFNGTMFLAIVELTINDNQQNPAQCPAAWAILGSVNTSRTTGLVTFIDGAGQTPPLGPRGILSIPFDDCVLTGYSLISDVVGSCVLDVLWSPYSGYPGSLTSIVGSNNPTLSNAQKSEVLDVSTLFSKVDFSEGDILQIVLDSASVLTQISLTLNLSSTN